MRSLFFLSAVLLAAVLSFQSTSAITVHLVPHTHDDVGWQVTVDQYYIGSVQYIITTVIEQLLVNPDRKFIYVEQAYFQRWWREQNDDVKNQVKQLVASGQLEFINGGWCMHDEASTHYIDMIDQTTYGHRFITEQFGVQPKVGWQIDPFGHSATQAALLSAEVGFEALFFGRIDYQDYDTRAKTKSLEWLWQASASLGEDASLFAGQFWNGYGPPDRFNFDIGSNDPPVQDDPRLTDYNVDERVNDFVKAAQEQASIFQGENLMWTMGSDFQYSAAHTYFTNLDKLIKAVNADGRVKAQYSTPSIYVEAKHAEGLTFTTKTDDIFPYSDGPDAYWTGYFTSRAALKRYVRVQSAFLQVARHLELFTMGNGSSTEALWEALGVAQHHDGVSGTAKQAVTFDYAKRLAVGGASADAVIQNGLAKLLTKASSTDYPMFSYCPLANTSICAASGSSPNLVIALYNALARERTELVRIPTSSTTATILNAQGNAITSQIVALPQDNPARTSSSLQYEIRFLATVPGLGIQTYFLQTQTSDEKVEQQQQQQPADSQADKWRKFKQALNDEALSGNKRHSRHLNSLPTDKVIRAPATAAASSIQNDIWRIDFDSNGLTSTITELASGTTTPFVQNFYWYHSFQEDNQQNSGAYIFRPANKTDPGTPVATSATLTVVSGAVTQEAQQTFAPWLTQVIRLINGSAEVQFEYTVGPIPIDDNQGKEVISRYTTNIASNGTWYTDSNGREWQKRVRNFRPTWNWEPTQPVAGNYYPVNTGIALGDDSGLAMSILNDRSQGGASLKDGELELMIHRRLTMDDGRGVGEPLSEPGLDGKGLITSGLHYVQLGKYDETLLKNTRTLQQRVYAPLHWSLAPLTTAVQQYLSSHNTQFTFLQTALPYQVELMSAYAQADGTVLVRLAHNFGVHELGANVSPVTVDLSTLFAASPKTVVERSITNNQTPEQIEAKKLKWNTASSSSSGSSDSNRRPRQPMVNGTVTIQPMEVRTFLLTF